MSYIIRNHKDTAQPRAAHHRGVGWVQPYILTRMLVRPLNLIFLKSGEGGFFCSKTERF